MQKLEEPTRKQLEENKRENDRLTMDIATRQKTMDTTYADQLAVTSEFEKNELTYLQNLKTLDEKLKTTNKKPASFKVEALNGPIED